MAGFESPEILLGLLALPPAYALYRRVLSRKKSEAVRFSSLAFVRTAMGDARKSRRGSLMFLLTAAAAALMIAGLAGPHVPIEQSREGVNVVLVIDVSGSMQARDYEPSRLEAAKGSAAVLVGSLQPKDHAGIVTFETGATTAAYLSPYKDRVLDRLANIAPRDGQTAMGDGLSLGIEMATSIPNKRKVVILLSDGVNNAGIIPPEEAVAFARASGITVHTVGMGTEEEVVIGYDFYGRPQFAELDEDTLRSIAGRTGGTYYKSVDSETLDEIYDGIGQDIEREVEESDVSSWFFAAALAALGAEAYGRYGRGRVIQ